VNGIFIELYNKDVIKNIRISQSYHSFIYY